MVPTGSGNGGAGGKPSKVEAIKIASQYLHVHVADEARNGLTHFTEDAATVLKFHGSYQQDDRDLRTQLKREGHEKAFQFMVRVRVVGRQDHRRAVPGQRRPGADGRQRHAPDHDAAGVPAPRRPQGGPADDHPPDQRDAALDPGRLRRRRAERAELPGPDPRRGPRRDAGRRRPLRLALRPAGRRATGTSGSTARRSTTRSCPRPARSRSRPPATTRPSRSTARRTCRASSRRPSPCPRTTAPTSCANDLGYLAVVEDGELVGYNVAGRRRPGHDPERPEDLPGPGHAAGYVDRDDVLKVGEAVIKVYRDFGNRSDRKRARLKYVIHDWGMPAFQAKVEEYLGGPLADPRPVAVTDVDDHLGWHEQGDGKLFLGIPVENGRIKDEGTMRLASGLRTFFEKYQTPGPPDLPAVDPADRPGAGLAGGHRGDPGGARHRHGRADLDGPAVVDGLPGDADLRPGRDRGRARPADHPRRAGGRARPARPRRRAF